MAYDVARGTTNTAFARFDRGVRGGCPDFSLGNGRLAVDSNQCEVAVKSENEVRIRVGGPDFSFSVTGFDDRDVVVRVTPLDWDEPGADSAEEGP